MGKLVFDPKEETLAGNNVSETLQHTPDHLNYRQPANLKRSLY